MDGRWHETDFNDAYKRRNIHQIIWDNEQEMLLYIKLNAAINYFMVQAFPHLFSVHAISTSLS